MSITVLQMTNLYTIIALREYDDGSEFYELKVSEATLRMLKSHAEKRTWIFLDDDEEREVFGDNTVAAKLPYLPPSSNFAGVFRFGCYC